MHKSTAHKFELPPKKKVYEQASYSFEPEVYEEAFIYGGEGYGALTDYLCDNGHFGEYASAYTNGYTFGIHAPAPSTSSSTKRVKIEPMGRFELAGLSDSSDTNDSSSAPSDKSPDSRDGHDNIQVKKRVHKVVDTTRFKVLDSCGARIKVYEDTTSTTCLGCSIDYGGFTGTVTSICHMNPYLINRFPTPSYLPAPTVLYPIQGDISSILCIHQRVRYDRDIWELHNTVSNIVYKTSSAYSPKMPYEPQYYRFELDSQGQRINMSKSGMCPYCPQVRFLPFKNLSYLSHLTLEHGIFSNNFLTPEGLAHGQYRINKSCKSTSKSTKESRTRIVDGIVCPHCLEVVEVGCWSLKHNKLLNYFRHFKTVHGEDTTNKMLAMGQITPVQARGRKLRILD